jgi:hypothetical protein
LVNRQGSAEHEAQAQGNDYEMGRYSHARLAAQRSAVLLQTLRIEAFA